MMTEQAQPLDYARALRARALLSAAQERRLDAETAADTDARADHLLAVSLAIRAAQSLLEEHLVTLGWKNGPDEVPAMIGASQWAEDHCPRV